MSDSGTKGEVCWLLVGHSALLCLAVEYRARFAVPESGTGRGLLCLTLRYSRGLLCLTVGHRAMFAVPDSGEQGFAVSQWGVVRALLCLRVWHRAKFAVSDGEVQSEV